MHGPEWMGRTVEYLGRTWRVYDVLPHGSLVLRSPWWLPRWMPGGGIVITSQLDDEPLLDYDALREWALPTHREGDQKQERAPEEGIGE